MKNSTNIILIILFLFSMLPMAACKKESENPEDLLQKWQVISFRRDNATSQMYPVKDYILQFKANGSVSFKRDVNSCEGNYTVHQLGKIDINILACTEICCDSDTAQELTLLLSHISTYAIREDVLTLNGIGKIKLKSIK